MRTATAIITPLLISWAASACNIPVFRYALERWRPDPCEVIVFHRGPLTAQQETLLKKLNPGLDDAPGASVSVDLVRSNLTQPSPPHLDLWRRIESSERAELPYVVVRTRVGPNRMVGGWHGPLDAFPTRVLVDSPARRELSRRLLAGHAIVWLLIGSGDTSRNEQAKRLLTDNLPSLANKIQLPEGIGLPGSELHSEVPLLLRFSLLEIDRNDASEQFLVDMLSGFRPEAVKRGQPLIVPVFGRGRALEVIPANELSPRLLEDLTVFLSSACSCQVKEQNPGFDLLLSVDWNTELFGPDMQPPQEKAVGGRDRPLLLTIPPGRTSVQSE